MRIVHMGAGLNRAHQIEAFEPCCDPIRQRRFPQELTEGTTSNFGDNKGTISVDKPGLNVSNRVRQHRLISISYMSLLPCHGRGRGFESRRPRHFLSVACKEMAPRISSCFNPQSNPHIIGLPPISFPRLRGTHPEQPVFHPRLPACRAASAEFRSLPSLAFVFSKVFDSERFHASDG